MKILELISIPTLTGAAAPMLNLSRRLKQAGCELDIYIDQYRPHNLHGILSAEGLTPCEGLYLSTIAPPQKNIADLLNLKRIIRDGKYDLILCHLSHDHALSALARSICGRKLPIVRCLHSERSLIIRPLQKLLWRHSDAVITHSQSLALALSERFSYPAERILYLPAEVDIERFKPPTAEEKAACRSSFGFLQEDFVLGYVARIKPGRRHVELLNAFAACRDTLPRMRLLVIGDGESLADLKKLALDQGVSNRIIFTGFIDDKLPQAYMAMDAYIQMAVGNDASCRAVLEAMACGIPVWTVPEAAISDCCKKINDDGIKTALGDIYNDDVERGNLARCYVEEKHSGSESPAILNAFLETLLYSAKSST